MHPLIWFTGIFAAALFILVLIFFLKKVVFSVIDKRIAVYQNDIIIKHCQEVQNIYREMRGWRHDYHNHIQTMKAYRALNQNEKLDEYLLKLDATLMAVDVVLKTGNVMVDAILNSKLSLAKNYDIQVNTHAKVPADISITDIDLCIIIGNLLDNAMEACSKIQDIDKRFIRVYIGSKKNQLYISVTNSTGIAAKKVSGKYISTKNSLHGFGLTRIDRLVYKYAGYIKARDEEGAFTSEVMLPL